MSDGMEKNVVAHANGADGLMEASSLSVTTSGLLALPLAVTPIRLARSCFRPKQAFQKES